MLLFSVDVLGNILKRLTAKRSRARVTDKIISMGLVSERKELYKKRRRSAAGKSKGMVESKSNHLYNASRFSLITCILGRCCIHLIYSLQTEDDFFADLSGEPRDDMVHRDEEDDDESEEDDEDDEEEKREEIRPVRERKVNSREKVVDRNVGVGLMAQSLREEGAYQ